MARPNLDPSILVNGLESWDGFLVDLLIGILKRPLPMVEYADFANLPDATQYDRCLACTSDNKLWWSKAGVWVEVTTS